MNIRRAKHLVLGAALLFGIAAGDGAYAQTSKPLKPRIDLTGRAGTNNRNIGVTEAWVPLAQSLEADEVMYTDARFMRDNGDNQEVNIGVGYRKLMPKLKGVVGAHVWYDQRETGRGTPAHQITAGAEYFSDKFDARFNAYVPVASPARTWITPNIGNPNPYVVGSGIYVDITGTIIEEPQAGFDLEFGAPVKWAENYVDSARVYGAIYSFYGDKTPDVSGLRLRAKIDYNSALSFGTRIQTDSARDEQIYFDATLRFPFSAKRMQKEYGLKSRLDESPERDIDIVTGEVVDTGGRKPILNTESGQAQRVLWVDNTAASDGDGTKERPYNTLKAAEAVLQDYDILYVARGDTTTAGMNEGLNITKNNVMMVGSGVNFVYDAGRFTPSAGSAANGYVLAAATANPIITNTAGTGVLVTGDDAYLTGFTVNGATADGIFARADAVSLGTFTAANLTATNNGLRGLATETLNGGKFNTVSYDAITAGTNTSGGIVIASSGAGSVITNATMTNSTSNSNGSDGLRISAVTGTVTHATMTGNTGNLNTSQGLRIESNGVGSFIDTINMSGNTGSSNTGAGIFVFGSTQGLINTVTLDGNTNNSNTGRGVYVRATTDSDMGTVTIQNSTANTNTLQGLRIEAIDAGSIITNATMTGNTTTGNTSVAQFFLASTNGLISNATMTNAISTGNLERGIYAQATNGGDIGTLSISNSNSSNNTGGNSFGIALEATGTGSTIGTATLTGNTTSNNTNTGILAFAQTDGSITGVTINNATSNGNASRGMYARMITGGDLGSVTVNNGSFNSNTGATGFGLEVETSGAGSTTGTVTFNNATTSNNAGQGTLILGQTQGVITTVNVSGATSSANADRGLYVRVLTDADLGTLSVTNSTFSSNTGANGRGIQIESNGAGSTIGTMTMTGNTTSNNASNGISVIAQSSGAITTATLSNTTASTNAGVGLYAQALTLGTINTLTLTGNTFNNSTGQGIRIDSNGNAGTAINTATLTNNVTNTNTQQGIYVFGNTAANLNSLTLTHNTATGNTSNGVYIDDDTTGTFVADMGGGVNAGTGQNRIFSNTGTEIRVDLDGGQLKAENNWWGVGTGLAGGETTLDAASTIDATPFLATDPGP